MPNYKEVVESVGTGSSQIDIKYEVGNAVNLSYPVVAGTGERKIFFITCRNVSTDMESTECRYDGSM